MPSFDANVDVDVDDFISQCNKREINEIIDILIGDGYLPQYLKTKNTSSFLGIKFSEKLNELGNHYLRISREDEEVLEKLFKKYL